MGGRSKALLLRQWRLISVLHEAGPRGLGPRALEETLAVAHATLYRDLETLREVGIPIEKRTVAGEARYGLTAPPLPALAPSSLELAALRLARHSLQGLEGLAILDELDRLLSRWSDRPLDPLALSVEEKPRARRESTVRELDRAIRRNLRIRFLYRSSRDLDLVQRTADPLVLRWVDGALYLIAWDLDREDIRTFKVPRIGELSVGPEPSDPHPDFDEAELFAHSVKVWSGDDLIDVVIRLRPEVAWLASEYPLVPDQLVDADDDGSVLVKATVAGIPEALRWVLRWGASAEAVAPETLREAVKSELAGALDAYGAEQRPEVPAVNGRKRVRA